MTPNLKMGTMKKIPSCPTSSFQDTSRISRRWEFRWVAGTKTMKRPCLLEARSFGSREENSCMSWRCLLVERFYCSFWSRERFVSRSDGFNLCQLNSEPLELVNRRSLHKSLCHSAGDKSKGESCLTSDLLYPPFDTWEIWDANKIWLQKGIIWTTGKATSLGIK